MIKGTRCAEVFRECLSEYRVNVGVYTHTRFRLERFVLRCEMLSTEAAWQKAKTLHIVGFF